METRFKYNQLPLWESTLGHGAADTGDRREKSGRGTDRRFGFVDSPPAPAIMGTALVGAILAAASGARNGNPGWQVETAPVLDNR